MAHNSILIVDDNPVNLKLMRILLAGAGHEVLTAADAEEGMQVIRESTPRLILMDVQLPGLDRLELTRRMKGDRERILAAGCDGYIPKPIDTRMLPGMIEEYLER